MTYAERKLLKKAAQEEGCDSRVWSGDCQHSDTNKGNEYLCVSCGKIPGLDHQVNHEIFPYVSGDYDNLY